MEDYVKFNNQTAGRDKVFRLLQYCSRVAWYNLEKRGKSPEGVARAKKVDETLGLMRRLLRFGRFFDTLHSALPVMSTIQDRLIRITSALSRISSACFMAIDHIVCLYKLGLLPATFIDAPAWDKTSTKFWLYSIVMGLIRDVYEMMKIYNEVSSVKMRKVKHHHNRHKDDMSEDGLNHGKPTALLKGLPATINPTVKKFVVSARIATRCATKHADITIDLVKNLCDLCIPLTVLGYMKLSPGAIGLLGIVSTVASAIPQINPMVKMVPAM